MDERDGNCEIYYKRSPDGGITWSSDRRLTNDPEYSEGPSISVSGTHVHAIWRDDRDGNAEIYYKHSSNSGISWFADARLTNDPYFSRFPSIVASGESVHVVWQDNRDGNWEIYYKRSTDAGLTWDTDRRLTDEAYESLRPSVSVSHPNVYVVWSDNRDYRTGLYEIYYKLSMNYGNNWSPDRRLTSDDSYSSLISSISSSGTNVHLAWVDTRDNNTEIYYKRSTDSGISWSNDSRLTNDANSSSSPSVFSSSSVVHLVWEDNRSGIEKIYYKRSINSGVIWSQDVPLTNEPTLSWHPSVYAFGTGVHVVWEDDRDPGWGEIYYKRNPMGNIGVEESTWEVAEIKGRRCIVTPNPFSTFTTISGHETECFTLFEVSGRQVGIYKGNRVGYDLLPGVYFLRPMDASTPPVRIVKIR